jgi:hypothetical protein
VQVSKGLASASVTILTCNPVFGRWMRKSLLQVCPPVFQSLCPPHVSISLQDHSISPGIQLQALSWPARRIPIEAQRKASKTRTFAKQHGAHETEGVKPTPQALRVRHVFLYTVLFGLSLKSARSTGRKLKGCDQWDLLSARKQACLFGWPKESPMMISSDFLCLLCDSVRARFLRAFVFSCFRDGRCLSCRFCTKAGCVVPC